MEHVEYLVPPSVAQYLLGAGLNKDLIKAKIIEINKFLQHPLVVSDRSTNPTSAIYETEDSTGRIVITTARNFVFLKIKDIYGPVILKRILDVLKAKSPVQPIRIVGPKQIPAGSEDAITSEKIKSGDNIVDFDNESTFGRYYLASTFLRLDKNPFTNRPISQSSVKYYTAKVTGGGKRRYRTKTLRRRKTHKRRRI